MRRETEEIQVLELKDPEAHPDLQVKLLISGFGLPWPICKAPQNFMAVPSASKAYVAEASVIGHLAVVTFVLCNMAL